MLEIGKRVLQQPSDFFIAGVRNHDSVPFQNAPRIRVNYKYRMISRIQKNGIRRLRSDAIQGQQFDPQLLGGLSKTSGSPSRHNAHREKLQMF